MFLIDTIVSIIFLVSFAFLIIYKYGENSIIYIKCNHVDHKRRGWIVGELRRPTPKSGFTRNHLYANIERSRNLVRVVSRLKVIVLNQYDLHALAQRLDIGKHMRTSV